MTGTHIDEARQTTLLQVLAAVTGQTDLRTEQSEAGTVEQNDFLQFYVSLFSVSAGAIPLASIDITGMTAVLSRSRAGGAFSPAGITQPTFTKGNGQVSCAYQFLLAQWEMGDIYRLVLSGIKATVGGDVVFVPDMVWANLVVESADLETTVGNIAAVTSLIPDAGAMTSIAKEADLISQGTTDFNATAKASIKAQDDSSLNTIVPATPTAGALTDILSKASGGNTFDKTTDSLEAIADTMALDSTVAKEADLISQGTTDFNATAKGSINTEVDTALDTEVPATPTAGALTDILSKAGGGNTFDKTTDSLEALADAIAAASTDVGTVFSVKKTITQSDVVGAGVDLTGVSSGLLELINGYVQNGSTAFTSSGGTAKLELGSTNVNGSDLALTDIAEANLIANITYPLTPGCVLESGKKIQAKAISEDFTSAGSADFYLIFRRLTAGATIAAA